MCLAIEARIGPGISLKTNWKKKNNLKIHINVPLYCWLNFCYLQLVSEMYLRIEIEPLCEPHAKTSPFSYGDHRTELTKESC